jgi:hypothetical protein
MISAAMRLLASSGLGPNSPVVPGVKRQDPIPTPLVTRRRSADIDGHRRISSRLLKTLFNAETLGRRVGRRQIFRRLSQYRSAAQRLCGWDPAFFRSLLEPRLDAQGSSLVFRCSYNEGWQGTIERDGDP